MGENQDREGGCEEKGAGEYFRNMELKYFRVLSESRVSKMLINFIKFFFRKFQDEQSVHSVFVLQINKHQLTL